MDFQKRKLLTQSIAFMQAYLNLSPGLLDAMRVSGVLTEDEVTQILKDELTSGKVIELICILKRKDNRAFSRFVEVLDKNNYNGVVKLLRDRLTDSDAVAPDPRTLQQLEKHLGSDDITPRALTDIAVILILREVYNDDIQYLNDKLANFQKHLRINNQHLKVDLPKPLTTRSSWSNMPRTTSSEKKCRCEELQQLLNEKHVIIHRKDLEYERIKKILVDTQNNLEDILALNNQYLTIISQLNSISQTGINNRTSEKDKTISNLEYKLAEAEEKAIFLSSEFSQVNDELHGQKLEAEKLSKREKKYKEWLGLPLDASEKTVELQIQKLLEDGSVAKQELDKISKDLKNTIQSKTLLDERLSILVREKEKIEFFMRQQDLEMKKMRRMKIASRMIPVAEQTLELYSKNEKPLELYSKHEKTFELYSKNEKTSSTFTQLPALPPVQNETVNKPAVTSSTPLLRGGKHFCIFCRIEYSSSKPSPCRFHYRPIRESRWSCCRDECHRSAGCLHVQHFYIQITFDQKIFLTDGARYLALT